MPTRPLPLPRPAGYKNRVSRSRRAWPDPLLPLPDPYREMWLRLTPAQRLRRSWRLRSRIPDLQAVHDAKSLPKL